MDNGGGTSSAPSTNGSPPPSLLLLPDSFKVVLLGEGAVGKSSILLRYTEDKFNPKHLSTLQAAFATKEVVVQEGRRVELNVWDTAGQEKFHALVPIYYRDSQGALLVYDMTDPRSFERVKNWVRELHKMLGDSVLITVVGNKLDLEANRVVSREEAESYALSVGARYAECSAKDNLNIHPIFDDLAAAMAERAMALAAESARSSLQRRGSRRSIRVVDDRRVGVEAEREQVKRKCC